MPGTDIYIISGTGKGEAVREVTIGRATMPEPMYNYIRENYSRNYHIGASSITADSEPDFDNWGPDDWWSCDIWMLYHQLNVQKYGQEIANQRFREQWAKQDEWTHPMIYCKFDSSFINYFKAQGIEGGWLISNLVVAAENVANNLEDSAVNTSDLLATLTSAAKVVAPFALVGAGLYSVDRWVYPIFGTKKKVA